MDFDMFDIFNGFPYVLHCHDGQAVCLYFLIICPLEYRFIMVWQNLSILSLFYTIFSWRVLKNLRKCKWDFLYIEMEIYIKKFLHIFETLSLSFHVTLLFIISYLIHGI